MTRTKTPGFISLAMVLVLLPAVARPLRGQKISIEFDQAADFTKYKTFAIRRGELNSKNPALNSELVKKQIEAELVRDFPSRGLFQTQSGPADLNLVYHFGTARKTEVEAYPAGWRGWGDSLCAGSLRRWDPGDRPARSLNAFSRVARNLPGGTERRY